MSLLRDPRIHALVMATLLTGCSDGKEPTATHRHDPSSSTPSFTLGSGSQSTLLGRATFSDPKDQNLKIMRITGDWHVDIKSKPAMDIAVQSIIFQPGAQSGWHRHPGPVFIQVVSGEIAFYESDDPTCTPIIKKKGEGYLDKGDHAHLARNETATPAQNIVTYFAPPGADLRIDAPRPGNCPF